MRPSAVSTVSALSWQIVAVVLSGLLAAWLVGRAPVVLVLGVLLAFIVGVAFLQWPETGLILLLVARASTDLGLSHLRGALGSQAGDVGRLLNPNAALILILILAGGLFVLGHRVPFIGLPAGRVFVLLLLVGLVGVIRSNSLLFSLSEWLPVVSVLIVYALVAHLFRDPGRSQRVVDALAASFVLPAVVGFYQLITGEGNIIRGGIIRIYSTFAHPNAFASYLVIVLGVFLCQALDRSGRRKLLSLCIVIASSVLLVGTFARFAWVGAAVVVLTVGVLRSRILLVVAPLIAAVAYSILPGISVRIEGSAMIAAAGRLNLWETIFGGWTYVTSLSRAPLAIALDRLAGLGPGAFVPLSLRVIQLVIVPHNDYLRVLVEYGLFGLFLFVTVYFLLIRLAYRTWKRSDGPAKTVALSFLAVTFAFAIMSITDNLFAQTVNQVYFWTLAGLVAAVGGMSAARDRLGPADRAGRAFGAVE